MARARKEFSVSVPIDIFIDADDAEAAMRIARGHLRAAQHLIAREDELSYDESDIVIQEWDSEMRVFVTPMEVRP